MPPNTARPTLQRLNLPPDCFAGQTAVVTGAGGGIGRAAALALGALGARVVIAELAPSGLDVERQIRQTGGQALFVQTDISQAQEVARLAEAVHAAFGPVSILVNNAILCPAKPVLEMEPELWDRVLAVNLRGAFLTCKAFLPDMLERQAGVIVNMVSTDAMPGLSAYIASKQGLAGFSRSLAAEVGQQGVRVIAFAPGMVDTPGLRGAADGLAPLLGLSPEQFLSLSLHPAYSGLMPAEDAGAATAYLIARLADEYHGDSVDGYAVLERAGVIASASEYAPTAPTATPGEAAASAATATEALELCQELRQAVAETEAEFNKLPVFVRPLARSGFKNKSGLSLTDWTRVLESLARQIEATQAGQPEAIQRLAAGAQSWGERLQKLGVYYAEVPAETARFMRDPQALEEVRRISEHRVALTRRLAAALQQFNE